MFHTSAWNTLAGYADYHPPLYSFALRRAQMIKLVGLSSQFYRDVKNMGEDK